MVIVKDFPSPRTFFLLLTINLSAVKLSTDEWKDKKVVIVSVPGAFTVSWGVFFSFFDKRDF